MYGKTYESMYEGSMVGAGLHVFAVWNYIITKTRRGVLEVNPKLLAFTLGGTEAEVVAALAFLCAPDPQSRSKAEGGRRLVKEGMFQFRVVNWEYYDKIKNEADRREYNRNKQAEYRAKKKLPPLKGEVAYVKGLENGTIDEFGVPISPRKREERADEERGEHPEDA